MGHNGPFAKILCEADTLIQPNCMVLSDSFTIHKAWITPNELL